MTQQVFQIQQLFSRLDNARRSGIFLSKVEALISESLDETACINKAVRSAVPFLSDICIAVFHPGADLGPILELAWRYPDEAPAAEALRASFLSAENDRQALSFSKHFSAADSVTLPLVSHAEKLGEITYLSTASGRRFLESDRALIEEFTHRVSTALHNCRQYSETCQAVMAREQFISIASHEMRSPLTALQMQFQMLERTLKDTPIPDRATQLIQSMKTSLSKVNDSISNLFDATRVQSGHFELTRQTVRLDEFLSQLAEGLAPAAERAGCELRLRLEPGLEGNWDPHRLEQAITNLLFNAFKYAPGQAVEIHLARQGEEASLSIRDHGPGVHPSDQARIFEMFQRGSSKSQVVGTGLGLFITRSIVLAHGGRIWLESMPGHGTEFIVLLPIDSAPGERQ